jgi:DNA polymerase elongation subunit (family B)
VKIKEPKVLFFDIETTPIKVWTFRLGEQYVSHEQIVEGEKIDIICITYCWDKGPAHVLDWDYNKQNSKKMIAEFDKIVNEADVIIGQNSDKFDVKHINTQRLLHGLPPFPDWADCSDDTLKQFKRHFNFPSTRLDYVSKLFGLGGKVKMELQDWIDIKEKTKAGKKKFEKMLKYGKKDVLDTRAVYQKIKPYIKPKFNMASHYEDIRCTNCGSTDIHKNGTRLKGTVKKQRFYCNGHGGHAGYATILKSGGLGKMTS